MAGTGHEKEHYEESRGFSNELAASHAQRIDSTGHNSYDWIFLSFSSEAFAGFRPVFYRRFCKRSLKKTLQPAPTYQNNCKCLKNKKGAKLLWYLELLRLTINHGSFWVRLTFPQRLQLCNNLAFVGTDFSPD